MKSQLASARIPGRNLVRVFLSPILVLSLQACIPAPSITHRVPVPDTAYARVDRPVGVEQIPMNVGVYFGSDFSDYKYEEYTIGRSKMEIPVGATSHAHFRKVLSAMFSETVQVARRPPYSNEGSTSDLSAIVEVRLEDFRYTAQSFGPSTASVTYRFVVYSPSGNTVSSWTESGTNTGELGFTEDPNVFVGNRVAEAMRLASERFMHSFQHRPEVQRWLALVDEKKQADGTPAPVSVDSEAQKSAKRELRDLKIEATLYSQHGLDRRPYHATGVRSQILAAHVKITNAGPDTILVRPSDITLSPRENVTLFPASPTQAAQRIFHASPVEGSDVVGGFSPLIGLIVAASEASAKDREIDKITNYFKSNQLPDTTVGPNGSVSGFVYFEALGIDGKFDEAALRVRVGEASSTENFDGILRVGRGTAVISGLAVASAMKTSSRQQRMVTAPRVEPAIDPAGPVRITSAQELLDLISNTTGSGKSESGTEFVTYSRADGRMIARTAKGNVDEGVWEVTGDAEYCRQWNNWRSGARDCFYVYRLEDGRYRFKAIDKPYDSTLSSIPGDPEQLKRRLSTAEGKPLQLDEPKAPLVAGTIVVSEATIKSPYAPSVGQETIAAIEPVSAASPQGHQSVSYAGTADTSASETPRPGNLRVALLPFASRCLGCNSQAQNDLVRFSREFLHKQTDVTVSYSYYQDGFEGGRGIDSNSLWDGYVQKTPRKEQVFSVADTLDADVALTFYHAPRTADSYASDLYSVDVYLFDLESKGTYHDRGNERNYKNVTARLFDALMADREASGTRMTIAASPATVVSSATTASVNSVAATQSAPVTTTGTTPAVEDGQLSGPELREFLSGNTVSGRTDKYVDFHIYFSPDGKMSGKARMTRYDAGTWQVDNSGTYCRQWDRWLSAARRCFKVFRVGENRIRFRAIDSNEESTHTIRFGDPENLKGRI